MSIPPTPHVILNTSGLQESSPLWRVGTFFILQVTGAVGLTLLLVTLLWARQKRRPTNPVLISLCFTWLISTFCELVLYFVGAARGPSPGQSACLTSAVLNSAQLALISTSSSTFVFHIWLTIREVTPVSCRTRWTVFCVIAPYIVSIAFGLASLGLGIKYPILVQRHVVYCLVLSRGLLVSLSVYAAFALLLAVAFNIRILFLIYYNHARLKQFEAQTRMEGPVVRTMIYTIYLTIAVGLNIASICHWESPAIDVFSASCPLAVFLVLGSQSDNLQTWFSIPRRLSTTIASIYARCMSAGALTRTCSTTSKPVLSPPLPLAPNSTWLGPIVFAQHNGNYGSRSMLSLTTSETSLAPPSNHILDKGVIYDEKRYDEGGQCIKEKADYASTLWTGSQSDRDSATLVESTSIPEVEHHEIPQRSGLLLAHSNVCMEEDSRSVDTHS